MSKEKVKSMNKFQVARKLATFFKKSHLTAEMYISNSAEDFTRIWHA